MKKAVGRNSKTATKKKVGEWCKEHWKELVIGAICIVIGAVLNVLTGGSFLAAGFKAAAMARFISGGISVMSSLIVSIFSGDSFKTILEKVLRSFVDGFASGFMWGGIFAGGVQTISAILKFSRSGTLIFGGEQLQLFKPNNFSGKTLGKIKIWSPNGLNNPNSGGTLFKDWILRLENNFFIRILHIIYTIVCLIS